MKNNKLILSLMLCLLVAVLAPATALAAAQIDESKSCSITVTYSINSLAAKDVGFKLYRVANIDSGNNATFTEDFNGYSLDINEVYNLAPMLKAYAEVYKIEPCYSSNTNSNGIVKFEKLSPGIYLICGEAVTKDGVKYICTPSVVAVPTAASDGRWDYSVVVVTKYESYAITSGGDVSGGDVSGSDVSGSDVSGSDVSGSDVHIRNTQIKVIKVWNDEKNASKRPESIEAMLVCNGSVIDTVTLSESNEWTHLWQNLDSRSSYYVLEKDVPEGYTVAVTQESTTFVITNSAEKNGGSDSPSGDDDEKLPQTGQLWWPVPTLSIMGMAMIIIGLAAKKESGIDN